MDLNQNSVKTLTEPLQNLHFINELAGLLQVLVLLHSINVAQWSQTDGQTLSGREQHLLVPSIMARYPGHETAKQPQTTMSDCRHVVTIIKMLSGLFSVCRGFLLSVDAVFFLLLLNHEH